MQIIDRDRRERMKEGGEGGDLEVREEESKEERECLPELLRVTTFILSFEIWRRNVSHSAASPS